MDGWRDGVVGWEDGWIDEGGRWGMDEWERWVDG